MFISVFLCFIGLFIFHPGSGQELARLRCVEVLNNGDAILHWIPEPVGTDAYSYTLYHSSVITGPYTLLDSITDLSQDSFIHNGAGANNAPQYYFMYVHRVSGQSPPSDTLATILLQASTVDFEVVDFSWTPLHDPFSSYMHPWYLLYKEYPPGTWTVSDSTQDLAISHHFWDCNHDNDTVRFRIGVRDNETGCISYSNRRGAVLKNLSNRFPPVIDSVSIDANGNSIIGWEPGSEPDIAGYSIFLVTSSNDSLDYVEGRLNTFYTHLLSDPCNGSLRYIILSIDSCGNESPFPYDPVTFTDKPHNTLFLQEVFYDPCLMTNTLTWNEYINFDPPLGGYRIYMSENGGPFTELVTVPPQQTSFIHEGLNPNTLYSYYVRAFAQGNSKTSTSCTRTNKTYDSPRPEFMYLRYVTVEDNVQVNVLFYSDTSAHVQYYRILRSESPAGPFVEVGQVPETGEESVMFSDPAAEVNASSYYYRVSVVDSCGIDSVIANTSRTIFLTVDALEDYINFLAWNAYESWDGAVEGYRIYRRLNDEPFLELLYQAGPSELTYADDVSALTGSVTKVSYLVEAYEGDGNSWGFQESSYSNEVLAEQESRIFMPNALLPKGLNNILKPVSVFVGSPGYEFLVYNRWGQLIFRTSNPEEGWDGKYNGQYVESGVYVYLIRYRNATDQPRLQKGNVAVIY